MEDHNAQRHLAHLGRDDGRRSPTGVRHREEELGRAFFSARFVRVLGSLGYARFRHWRVYGEGGWLKATRLEGYAPRAPRRPLGLQQPLFPYREASG